MVQLELVWMERVHVRSEQNVGGDGGRCKVARLKRALLPRNIGPGSTTSSRDATLRPDDHHRRMCDSLSSSGTRPSSPESMFLAGITESDIESMSSTGAHSEGIDVGDAPIAAQPEDVHHPRFFFNSNLVTFSVRSTRIMSLTSY